MAAMPARFDPAHDEATIRDIVERFEKYEIHLVEARALIVPALGVEMEDRSERHLTEYLDAILDRVHSQEISIETAASDMWQMALVARAGDADFDRLEVNGPE